jgi:hypothetical protein
MGGRDLLKVTQRVCTLVRLKKPKIKQGRQATLPHFQPDPQEPTEWKLTAWGVSIRCEEGLPGKNCLDIRMNVQGRVWRAQLLKSSTQDKGLPSWDHYSAAWRQKNGPLKPPPASKICAPSHQGGLPCHVPKTAIRQGKASGGSNLRD